MIESRRASIEKRLTIGLLIILAASIVYTKNKMNKRPIAAGQVSVVSGIKAITGIFPKVSQLKLNEKEGARDPLIKPPEIASLEAQITPIRGPAIGERGVPGKEEPVLQGVILGGKEKLAIISGHVVTENDVVNGAKVLQITDEGVTLVKNNSRIELKR